MPAAPTLSYYPAASNDAEAGDIYWRAAWHFRALLEKGARVFVPAHVSQIPARPNYLCATEKPGSDTPAPTLTDRSALELARASDHVIVWSRPAYLNAPKWLRRKAVAADELCDFGAPEFCNALVNTLLRTPADAHNDQARYAALAERLKQSGQPALILGSGPSVELALNDSATSTSIRIYVGTAIQRRDLVARHPPDIIIAADAASQLGPSATAAAYREAVFAAQRRSDAYVLITEHNAAACRAWWPEDLLTRTIAIPETRRRAPGTPLTEDFSYQPTSNVLTSLALPAAASVSDDVYLAGFDGASAATAEWSHTAETDYQCAISAMVMAHPRFHIADYPAYYRSHRARLAAERTAFETQGLTLRPIHGAPELAQDAPEEHGRLERSLTIRQWLYQHMDAAMDYPASLTTATALAAASGGAMISGWALAVLAGGGAAALAALFLHLRQRMNRMAAQTERNLAATQVRALRSIDARLQRLEEARPRDQAQPDTNDS